MNRRAYIGLATSGIVGSLAGCIGTLGTGSDARRAISVTSMDDPPSELAFDVDVVDETMHGDEPATIEITVDNTTSETVQLSSGHRAVFGEILSDDSELGVFRTNYVEADSAVQSNDGCWQWDGGLGVNDVMDAVVLDADDSASLSLHVYGVADEIRGECPESGTYRFEERYLYTGPYPPEDVPYEPDDFTWGFELTVE